MICARITLIFSTLVKSGLDLLKSIEITGKAAGNVVYQEALQNVSFEVQKGKSLAAALGAYPIFPTLMVDMIQVGEESGRLADMIERLSMHFEAKVDVFAGRIGVLIEPIILVFVGAMVGTLVLAMFLPIFNLSSAIH